MAGTESFVADGLLAERERIDVLVAERRLVASGPQWVVETTTLYRPVGQPELDLIEAADWRRFPPRLDWQPIFYPVLSEPYACC